MSAYTPIQWHDFFVSSIGASAALTGLLFVGLSVNLARILEYPRLPGRAAATLTILLSAVFVGSFVLAPGQSDRVLGAEIAVTGAAVAFLAVWFSTRAREANEPTSWKLEPFVLLQLPGLALLAGGLSLVLGGGGGFYWLLGGTILTFLVAAINAWVLLIEILR
jgi:modulator of FtsH protease